MQYSSTQFPSILSLARAGLATAVGVFLLGAAAPRLAAQSADFNAGNDTGWQHYSLPSVWGASFTFPPDDTGGKAYKISAPPSTPAPLTLGNARAGSFFPNEYTGRFSVGTDLLDWHPSWHQESGILFYFQDINLGTSDGYIATYSSDYLQLYISLINDEVPTTIGELGSGAVVLDPTHRYRLVVSSHDGSTYLSQLFDKSQPNSPWTSAIAQDSTYSAGLCGLFVFEQNYPSDTEGAEATFDNYVAAVPAAGAMPAIVTDLSPPPARKATDFYPTVTVGILDRDTTVDATSITLCLDDVWIPNSSLTIDPQVHRPSNPGAYPRDFGGATATYTIPTLLPWGSQHTNKVAFKDSANTWQTNTWTWTTAYPHLFASNSLPLGSLSVRGFDARTVQSDNGGTSLDNTLARALQQLAIPPTIPIDRKATSIVQVLSWDETTAPPENVPGLCGGNYINIAVESLAYLELSAGLYRFHISTDDRCGLYSGAGFADANAQALWENPGNTADTTFDVAVEAAGLYPIRCIWEETGGGAHLHLWSTNITTGDPEVLINDPANPAGVVKAWYPLVLRSSASVAGPYAVDSSAVNLLNTADVDDPNCSPTVVGSMVTGGTFTVPISGTARYYRLEGPRSSKITKFEKTGSNIKITYQLQ